MALITIYGAYLVCDVWCVCVWPVHKSWMYNTIMIVALCMLNIHHACMYSSDFQSDLLVFLVLLWQHLDTGTECEHKSILDREVWKREMGKERNHYYDGFSIYVPWD